MPRYVNIIIMKLSAVAEVLHARAERRQREPTPEEAHREERFKRLGERIIALRQSGRPEIEPYETDERATFPKLGVYALFRADENRTRDMALELVATYAGKRIDPRMPLSSVTAKWWETGTLDFLDMKVSRGELYDFPEDSQRNLSRLEQSVEELETAAPEALVSTPETYWKE